MNQRRKFLKKCRREEGEEDDAVKKRKRKRKRKTKRNKNGI